MRSTLISNISPSAYWPERILTVAFYTPFLADPSVFRPVLTAAGADLVGTAPVPVPSYVTTIIDLYEADAEGIANGKKLGAAELPNGFVQGKRYVASLVANSAADLDRAAGAFRFNISSLGLAGSTVTVTANYSEQPAGAANAAVV